MYLIIVAHANICLNYSVIINKYKHSNILTVALLLNLLTTELYTIYFEKSY